jgi:hypothetical protein
VADVVMRHPFHIPHAHGKSLLRWNGTASVNC